MAKQKYIIGNWKLHKNCNDIKKFFTSFNKQLIKTNDIVFGFAPTTIYLTSALQYRKSKAIEIIAQDVSDQLEGSYTGQVSSEQLKDFPIHYTIVGHSETRQYLACSDDLVGEKAVKAIINGIRPIICIGEKYSQRNNPEKALKQQLQTIFKHLKLDQVFKCLIAYEPIWAIGSGVTPTLERITNTATFIFNTIKKIVGPTIAKEIPILYGGSVKADNALDIMKQKHIDGLLIGGTSLYPDQFAKIIKEVNLWIKRK